MTVSGRGLLRAAAAVAAGLVPAMVLAPAAAWVASGLPEARHRALVLLLLEAVYLLFAFVSLGLARRAGAVDTLVVLAPAWLALVASGVAGGHVAAMLRAQPAALATAILGWGLGRAFAKTARGAALPFLLAAAVLASVVPIASVAHWLVARPAWTELLLATNPLIAVSRAGGFDPVRSGPLYDALPLSGLRFRYPGPWLPPVLLASTGIVLGVRLRSRRAPRSLAPRVSTSREVLS